MRATRAAIRSLHVAQWQRAKRDIEDAAARFLDRQLIDAGAKLRELGVPTASLIFKPREWDDRLRESVGAAVAHTYLLGAARELGLRKRPEIKSTAGDWLAIWGIDLSDFEVELPPALLARVESAIAEAFQAPHWQAVNGTTANHVQTIIRNGTTQGLSIADMAHQLEHSEMYARSRAMAIARTESSRGLNAGAVLSMQQTAEETGLAVTKIWLSVNGATTRATHAAADGQEVGLNELFTVGGETCRWPADESLSAGESVNCLCTTISGLLQSELEPDENDADERDQ